MSTQTTQHTLKTAISNVLELGAVTKKKTDNFNGNFQREAYNCHGCVCACN